MLALTRFHRVVARRSAVSKKIKYWSAGNNAAPLADNAGNQYRTTFYAPPSAGAFLNPDDWKVLAMRTNLIAGIKKDGSLWTAGANSSGQCGLGHTSQVFGFTRVGTRNDWVDVGCGTSHMGALDADGKIWSCGNNDQYQCGKLDSTTSFSTLYDTTLAATSHPQYRPSGLVFVEMKIGHRFTMGRLANGDVYTWGNNGSLQLGRAYPPTPGQGITADPYCAKIDAVGPFTKIFAGGYMAAALRADGTLSMWGATYYGSRGATNGQFTPADVPHPAGKKWADAYLGEDNTFLLDEDGYIFVAGRNSGGSCGVGVAAGTQVNSFVQLGTDKWKTINCDLAHTGGIKLDGSLWMWGSNGSFQFGNGTNTGSIVPIQIGTDTDWHGVLTSHYSTTAFKLVSA